MVVTSEIGPESIDIIRAVRKRNGKGKILVLSEGEEDIPLLRELSVQKIIRPDFEAELEMARQVLLHLDFPAPSVQNELNALRRVIYEPLYQVLPEYEVTSRLQAAASLMTMEWAFLDTESPLAGKTLAESAIRRKFGVSVVAVGREGKVISNPDGDFLLRPGDYVGIAGDPELNMKFLLSLKDGSQKEDAV